MLSCSNDTRVRANTQKIQCMLHGLMVWVKRRPKAEAVYGGHDPCHDPMGARRARAFLFA